MIEWLADISVGLFLFVLGYHFGFVQCRKAYQDLDQEHLEILELNKSVIESVRAHADEDLNKLRKIIVENHLNMAAPSDIPDGTKIFIPERGYFVSKNKQWVKEGFE